jgi:HEPN domain-containing protein
MSDPKEAAKLLAMARKDLQAMRALAAYEAAGIETFGFHGQQAVEKGLKAWLAAKGVLYPRIHDLDRLLDLLRAEGAAVPAEFDALGILTDFGVAFRYEAYDEIDEPFDRAQIIGQVERLLHHLAQLLAADQSP